MKGAKAEPWVSIMINPSNNKTIIIGASQYRFLFFSSQNSSLNMEAFSIESLIAILSPNNRLICFHLTLIMYAHFFRGIIFFA